jgi:putative transposase
MRRYRTGAHAKYDLKVHIVWVPKYRKRLLTGPVAVRTRDLLRQIATENDLHIISGKVAADHVHMFLSYRAHQNISQIVQWLRARVRGCVPRIPTSQEAVLGSTSLGAGILCGNVGQYH